MINPTAGHLKSTCILLLALSIVAPTFLIAQQAITPTAVPSFHEKPPATQPVYDVATIKRGNWGLHGGSLLTGIKFRDNSFVASEIPLLGLVCAAYGVQGYQVSGGPEWARSGYDGYDVNAKSTEESTAETLHNMEPRQAKLIHEQMLQALLADRFKLIVHHDTRQLPMSELVVSKGGLKILPNSLTTPDAPKGTANPPNPTMNYENATEGYLITAKDYSMDGMAAWLASELRHPVKNMTALNGSYDFKLHYLPEYLLSDPSASSFTVPTLAKAIQEQLGLKLELKKGPVEIIVIDHVERPSEN